MLSPPAVKRMLRVVPLFETLDDLNHAEAAMRQLFSTPWYAAHIQGKQVRRGEKDGGRTHGWARWAGGHVCGLAGELRAVAVAACVPAAA